MSRSVSRATGNAYARIFAVPGAKAFSLAGAVARLPLSMMSLGIVLALNHLYDNWTIAGVMSAAYILAVAAVTPLYARLFDRFGQRRVGTVVLTVQVVVMLAFAFAALMRVPIALLFVLAVLMGLTQFSFGALVRTRWAYVLPHDDETLLNTAYSFEAAVDEVVFILGPILSAFLATSVHPVSQLFVPTAACAIGGAVFFSLRNTQPPIIEQVVVEPAPPTDDDVRAAVGVAARDADAATLTGTAPGASPDATTAVDRSERMSLDQLHVPPHADRRNVLLYAGILPLMATFLVFNMSFNAFDVSMTAFMKSIHLEQMLGVQLAMLSLGSCIGAFVFGTRRLPGSHWRHMLIFLTLLAVGFLLVRMAAGHLVLMGVLEVLAGLTISSVFTAGNMIVKETVPASSLTEGLSWLSTAGAVGGSFGSLVAGNVLDHASTGVGLMLPCLFVAASLPIALLGWWLSHRPSRA